MSNFVPFYTPRVISDDFEFTEQSLLLKAGGTASVDEGDAILVFDKKNMSSLNDICFTYFYIDKIVTKQANIRDDTMQLTIAFGFYHDQIGFIQLNSSSSYSVNITENSTTKLWYNGEEGMSWQQVYNIEDAVMPAVKITAKVTNTIWQASFEIPLSQMRLMLDVEPKDYYYYIDLDGGTYSIAAENMGGGVIRQKMSRGWAVPEKEGYGFIGFLYEGQTIYGIPTMPSDAKFTTDVHLKALWQKMYAELTCLPSEGCSGYTVTLVSGSYYNNNRTDWFTPGSYVHIIASPEPDYKFKNWDNGSTNKIIGVTLNADKTVQAFFEKIEGSNVYVGNILVDVYRGNQLMDVYVGTTLI